jgi:hypothetical protein
VFVVVADDKLVVGNFVDIVVVVVVFAGVAVVVVESYNIQTKGIQKEMEK